MRACDFVGILAILNVAATTKVKRSLERSTLIVCEGGELVAFCTSGTSVNVTVADYGRTSIENICAKAGYEGNQLCRSESALSLAHAHCKSQMICRLDVNVETLGRPITKSGGYCFDSSTYIRLEYTCVRDCQTPVFNYNTEVIGDEYQVGATVTVHCRRGYQDFDGTRGEVVKTCLDDGTWGGRPLICQDINECENPSSNRCHMFAKCKNTRGSYSCTCVDGYHGDGILCTSDKWFSDDELTEFRSNSPDFSEDDEWDAAVLDTHDEGICGNTIIRERHGVLKSPLYPLNYPSSTKCIWIIMAPASFAIELRFMKFSLEDERPNEGCSRDNVTIYDSLNKDPIWWRGTFCGNNAPSAMLSQTNKLRIEFQTDHAAEYAGFEIRFTAVNLNFACLNFPAPSHNGIFILNGFRNSTTQPRKSLQLACQEGYEVISTNLVRTCRDDGTWDDFTNPCQPVSCGQPYIPPLAEGLVVAGGPLRFRYKEIPVRYECEKGYRMVRKEGNVDVIMCGMDGKWSNSQYRSTPECEQITCFCDTEVTCTVLTGADPPHQALRWSLRDDEGVVISNPVGQALPYGSRIDYSCDDGYVISGDDVRFCGVNGWGRGRTTCEEAVVPGLSNYHIAIIASAASAFVIIIIALALVICCCRDRSKKKKKRKQAHDRRLRAARDNNGFVMNYALAGNEDFLYGNSVDRRGRSKGFAGKHNDIRKYHNRPYMLPDTVPSSPTNRPMSYHPSQYSPRLPPSNNGRPRSYLANDQVRYGGNSTFQPNQVDRPALRAVTQELSANHVIRSSNSNGNERRSSLSKIAKPPPGYQEPPPSYDTMVREGHIDHNEERRKKSSA